MELKDLNGDGNLDIVTQNYSAQSFSVLLGNGNGTFSAKNTFVTGGLNARSVTVADVNSDGILDVLVASDDANEADVFIGNSDGTFKAKTSFAVGNRPLSIIASDLNGDGVQDIVTANYNSANLSVLLGNGTPGSTSILSQLGSISIASRSAALNALTALDRYFDEVNTVTSIIGSSLSRFSIARSNLTKNIDETTAAQSRITDADIAAESAALASTKILQQSAAAVLAHAQQQPALALKLLGQSE